MQQLAVGGLAARKTHGVEADADRKHVCAHERGCVPACACLCTSVCEMTHVLRRWYV